MRLQAGNVLTKRVLGYELSQVLPSTALDSKLLFFFCFLMEEIRKPVCNNLYFNLLHFILLDENVSISKSKMVYKAT